MNLKLSKNPLIDLIKSAFNKYLTKPFKVAERVEAIRVQLGA